MTGIEEKAKDPSPAGDKKEKRRLRARRTASLFLFGIAAAGRALSESGAAQDAALSAGGHAFGSVGGYLIIGILSFLLGIFVALAGISRRKTGKKDGDKR